MDEKGYEHKHFTDLNEFKIKQVERQQAVRICIQDEATPSSYYLPTKDIYHVTPKELGRENRREVQETLGTIMMGIIIIEAQEDKNINANKTLVLPKISTHFLIMRNTNEAVVSITSNQISLRKHP